MTNTYAINVTRGKEFRVADDLRALGLHPWVPLRLAKKWVKSRKEYIWYDRPYVHKLIFCVIPAIYFRDVVSIKHVIGQPTEFSRLDIDGMPECTITRGDGTEVIRPARHGLKDFQRLVDAEYADTQRQRDNSEYQCEYQPGQALKILLDGFEGRNAVFIAAVKRSHDAYHKIRVDAEMFGQSVTMEIEPDRVRAAE